MTEIHIKQLRRSSTKFSVNGKLCVIESVVGKPEYKTLNIRYHKATTEFERQFFKKYLEVLNLI